ncbi:phage tail tube protein [Acinetobacter sp. Ver3]|uniref:phage tail tube protein n=1 Tax=Acinetobacter sp. Ver3 TaxID=466088 RepID=UPI00044E88B3|nr:phage tail tube protein [Acinetobacter sp. Ver3]EZQ10737.1 hypothetical protein CL42_06285 [Acinetobacter sp. Ver3]
MSSGAKQILQIAKETVIGTTPSPFARQTIAFTSTSLNQEAEKTASESIVDSRLQSASMVTKASYGGDISAEAVYGAYDDLIAAAAFNAWATNSLTFGGVNRQTFSILYGYADVNNYHTFAGMHVNSFAINIPSNGKISFTFGFMGQKRTVATSAPAGTITAASTNKKLSNVSVGEILLDGVSTIGNACISAFSFNWDNSMQVQECLGKGLEVGAILETAAVGTGSFTVAWGSKAAEYYEKQFTNTPVTLVIPITDADGNKYTLTIPKAEVSAPLATGSKTDILQTTFEYTVVDQAPTLVRTPKA